MCPGGVFVVEGLVFEAAVEDADEPVAECSEGLVVEVSGVVGCSSRLRSCCSAATSNGSADFYEDLGFTEMFRVPGDPAIHIDVALDGYKIGIVSIDSTRDDHGLEPVDTGQRAAVVLWTDDTESACRSLLDIGCDALYPLTSGLTACSIAWIGDSDDHSVQTCNT